MTACVGQIVHVVVDETSKVGDARRQAVLLARELGLNDTFQGKIALVTTEAATNLVKHAGGGELLVQAIDDAARGLYLDLSAIDRGAGMKDVGQCLVDGYSTAGSPGTGLGAIGRIADWFDVYSRPSQGTILSARLYSAPSKTTTLQARLRIGAIRVPCPGEQLCGDGWTVVEKGNEVFVLVVDGLGHGPIAAAVADEAVRAFRSHTSREPAELLDAIHLALRGTRGAALAIARIGPATRRLHYAGMGNISGVILDQNSGTTLSMVSQNGTVGYAIRKIQTFDYPWLDSSVLIMHSDGVGTHWNFDRFPGLARRHPTIMAAALYREQKRGRDDATVLVAQLAEMEHS